MLGERYFATRDRLRELMRGIDALAAETGVDTPDTAEVDAAAPDLDAPFQFLVCGEVNAGKSSLLNAIFGHELCDTGDLPDTGRIRRYRHGTTRRREEISPQLEDRHHPAEFLRNFQLIDTPGANSSARGHLDTIGTLLPAADLVLFVFSIANPWEATTWDLLARLDDDTFDRAAIVVQQCDLRERGQVEVILGHLRELSLKRLGRLLPTFAVSAHRAMLAKREHPPAYAPWQASGFGPLEDHISRRICHSPRRRRMLDHWRKRSAHTLQRIEERTDDTLRAVNRSDRFLAEIEREIDALRQGFVLRLPRHLAEVTGVFQREAAWVAKRLNRRLGPASTLLRLFTGDRSGTEIENLFITRLQTAVETVATQDAGETVETCRRHRTALAARVKEEIGVELGESTELEAILGPAKDRFIERLGRAARSGIGGLKGRHALEVALRQRRTPLKTLVAFALLALTTAGVTGTLDIPFAPWAALGLAGVCGILFALGSLLSRREIVDDFRERLLDACGGFASGLRGDYEEALRVFFQDYTACLGEVKRHLARQKLVLEPRMQRWNGLFLALKAVEQDL